jgi:hypothetical protein
MRFHPGAIVTLHRPPSATFAQVVDVDYPNLSVLVKYYPRIDYARLIQQKLTSQHALSAKMDRTYLAPEVPFQPISGWPIETKTMHIWDQTVTVFEWDGSLFLGQFEYLPVPVDDLQTCTEVSDAILSRFAGGMADFERDNPAFVDEFLGQTPASVDFTDMILRVSRTRRPKVVDRGTDPIFNVRGVYLAPGTPDTSIPPFVGPAEVLALIHGDFDATPGEIRIRRVDADESQRFKVTQSRSATEETSRENEIEPISLESESGSDASFIQKLQEPRGGRRGLKLVELPPLSPERPRRRVIDAVMPPAEAGSRFNQRGRGGGEARARDRDRGDAR